MLSIFCIGVPGDVLFQELHEGGQRARFLADMAQSVDLLNVLSKNTQYVE